MSIAHITTMISSPLMKVWATANVKTAKTLGELLTAKRSDYEGTPEQFDQYVVADAIGFSQPYVSQIEKGHAENRVRKWPSKKQQALLEAYKFTTEEIAEIGEKFNLDLPGVTATATFRQPAGRFQATAEIGAPPENTTTLEATRRFEVQDTHITFRVYAGISAGHEEAEPIEGEAFSIPSADLSGIDPVCVRVYRVNGDCMVSESARGLTMNICSGDKIAVDISQRIVNNNDVIAAYWRPGDKLVVKRYVEAGDHIVLKPTSPTHPPLIAQNNDDFEIIGKVVWRGGPFRA